jgi:hypothetical protein
MRQMLNALWTNTVKRINIRLLLLVGSLLAINTLRAQEALFQPLEPLAIKFSFSFKDVKKNKDETVFESTNLSFQSNSAWSEVPVSVRARGNFRRDRCFFPPLKLRVKPKDVDGTVFKGHKNFKLVLPCQQNAEANQLIIKEILGYKLYELVSPYHFPVRQVAVELTDLSAKQEKSYQVLGILVADDAVVAKKHAGKLVKDLQLSPLRIQDTLSVRHDFFQFMIANTDWSTFAQHNVTVMKLEERYYIPLPYDFDMSGLVNAPYSLVSADLPIKSVTQRLYRGVCRDESLFQHVRAEYLAKEDEFIKVIDQFQPYLDNKEFTSTKNFIMEFFQILKNDRKFKEEVVLKCRT